MSEGEPRQAAPVYAGADPNLLIGRLSAKNKQFRMERDAAVQQATSHQKELERISAENEDLKKLADNSVSNKRVQELEGRLREVAHRKAFDRAAKANGARESGLDDLWKLSGYKAETDEIDPSVIDAVIDQQKTQRPLFFGEDPNFDPRGLKEGIPKPGPASGQGAKPGSGTTGFTLPAEDDPRWSDVKWQWTNRDAITDAINKRLENGVV